MQAGGSLIERSEILNLMDRLSRLNHAGMIRIHIVGIGRNELACVFGNVAIIDAEILHPQPPNWRGHPAVLSPVIVDAAHLSDFPANGDHFEEIALEHKISRVMRLRVEKVG